MRARAVRISFAVICGLLLAAVGCAQAAPVAGSDDAPVQIPLTVSENPHFGTYSAKIAIALGNGKPLPFGFDTGSSGLHVFADADLDKTDGVRCTKTPTSVTYGNPARITFTGVVCYAQLHFDDITTPSVVPVAYLTSASCPATNPECRIPDLHSPRAMKGYGVFGAGLTGIMSGNGNVPNPILTLPGRRGSIYSVILRHDGGELLLGSAEPRGAVEFPLTPSTRPGQRYSFPQTCLFVNGEPLGACLSISFDTGNGVPWIHSPSTGGIPQEDGVVRAGTQLGFAPAGESRAATSVVAGTSFADTIKIVDIPGKAPLTNVSIQAFFDHVVTYDSARGVIAVAPQR
jgi:hypothetical protein